MTVLITVHYKRAILKVSNCYTVNEMNLLENIFMHPL